MAFLHCTFKSVLLGREVGMNVVIPQHFYSAQDRFNQASGRKYRTLFLLHGLSDDHSAWSRYTSIERYAAARDLAVVMPDGGRSFYTDALNGFRYWSFISEELPSVAAEMFPLSLDYGDCFAAGLSMGGYGALKLAMRHPERFAAAVALSPVVDLQARFNSPQSASWLPEMVNIFGSPEQARENGNDLFALADSLAGQPRQPKLLSICGLDDFMLEDNRNFNRHMQDIAYPEFHYFEYPGNHNWIFWDRYIQDALDFLLDGKLPKK